MIKTFSLDVMGEAGSGGTLGCLKGCDGQSLVEDQVVWFNTTFRDSKGNRVRIAVTVTNIVERTVSGNNPIYDTGEAPPVAKNGHTYTLAYDTEDLPAGVTALNKCDLYTDKLIACPEENTGCCPVFDPAMFSGEGTEESPLTLTMFTNEGDAEDPDIQFTGNAASITDALKAALAACEFRTAVSNTIAAPGPNTKITAIYYRNGLGNEELAYSNSVGLPWSTDTALEAAINNPANGVPEAGKWDAAGGRLKIESAIDYTRIVVCDSVSGATASVSFACEGPEGHNEELKQLVRALGYDPAFVAVSSGGSTPPPSGGSGGGSAGLISTYIARQIGQYTVPIPDNATKLRIESVGAGGANSVGATVIAEIAIASDGVIAVTDSLIVSVGQSVNYTNPTNYATGVFKGSYSRANALAVAGGGGAFGRVGVGPALGQAFNGNSGGGGSGGNTGVMAGANGSLNNETGTYVGAGGYGYEGGTASTSGGNGGTSFIHASALVRDFLENNGRYVDGDQPNTEGFTDFNGVEGRVQQNGYVKLIFSN